MPRKVITTAIVADIRRLTKERHTDRQIAAMLGINRCTVSKYKSDRQIREEVARQQRRVLTPEQYNKKLERARMVHRLEQEAKNNGT